MRGEGSGSHVSCAGLLVSRWKLDHSHTARVFEILFHTLIDSGMVGSTELRSSHPQGHEPEHHAFSSDGKRQLAKHILTRGDAYTPFEAGVHRDWARQITEGGYVEAPLNANIQLHFPHSTR